MQLLVDQITGMGFGMPDLLAVEGGAFGSNRRDEQQMVMGVIRLVLYRRFGLRSNQLVKAPPSSAKKSITGYGLATKEQIALFAQAYIAGADEHCHDSVGVALNALERIGLMLPGQGIPQL